MEGKVSASSLNNPDENKQNTNNCNNKQNENIREAGWGTTRKTSEENAKRLT
jgi:hypothetical protein